MKKNQFILYLFNTFSFFLYLLLGQKFGKNRFSDTDLQKRISDS